MNAAVVDTNVLITFLEGCSRVADALGRFDKLSLLQWMRSFGLDLISRRARGADAHRSLTVFSASHLSRLCRLIAT